ncbi:TetR/AcrR family transcriptional regulator [Amnibacterium flavum]|uniref:TetR/AcrR family transcriptional regulator n=1 Tax=Amnibacterium flavum TaxID=2173173 RepID=UPI001402F29B|nr:TetR/AcrR family transcriptional regulator [Amnibacterium flavum]
MGRPRRSSRASIEDAAAELFLEQGYAGTTVEQITQRAGVSRATFFNYFAAKSDVLWSSFDESAGRLRDELRAVGTDRPPIDGVRQALLVIAQDFPGESAPWAVAEAETMGTAEELGASGLPRFAAQAAVIAEFLRTRLSLSRDDVRPPAAAAAIVAATAAAAGVWVNAGASRGSLASYVEAAITPVCAGFAAALDGA